jgi:hypothetical protein
VIEVGCARLRNHKRAISVPAIESSMMCFADYNAASRQLTITFKAGSRYVYFNVPQPVFDGLLAAPSAGHYFDVHIRDRYEFKRIWS